MVMDGCDCGPMLHTLLGHSHMKTIRAIVRSGAWRIESLAVPGADHRLRLAVHRSSLGVRAALVPHTAQVGLIAP